MEKSSQQHVKMKPQWSIDASFPFLFPYKDNPSETEKKLGLVQFNQSNTS